MATGSVETQSTVELNSVKYWLGGAKRIKPQLVSVFPEKSVTGDYTIDSNPLASTWGISDLTDGLGIMEMDEEVHSKRFWFANATTNYRGHIRLPKRATAVTTPNHYGSTWTSPTSASSSPDLFSNEANVYDDSTSTYTDQNIDATSTSATLTANIASTNCNRVRIWWTREASNVTLTTADVYYDAGWHAVTGLTGVGAWVYGDLVTNPESDTPKAVTAIRLQFTNSSGGVLYVRVHEIDFGKAETGNTFGFAEFNEVLYMFRHQALFKLNATGDGWTDVKINFRANITDINAGVNSCLYIGQGPGENYWYMSTAEAFTQTNIDGVDLWVVWDAKQFYLDDADNQIYYSATPNSATPSWTANGTLDLIPIGQVNNLYVDQNSAGAQVIFAATKQGLFAHDYTNAVFIRTGLKIPVHPNGGLGAAIWRESAYLSAGLDILAYDPSSEGDVIKSVGLSREDGLPSEYNGEVTKLISGYNELYALVDATQATGTSTSFIAAYDGAGWYVAWVDSSTERTLTTGAVSSVYEYRFWFVTNNATTYLPIERGLRNPTVLSTYTYGASGFVVTPWFDGNWRIGNKRANQITIGHAGVSANETIVVKYRINHATTSLASTWTTMGTIVTGTETTYSFGSSAGVTFKDIQFRFDLARGSTTTNSPEIRYVTLEYNKIIPKVWGWSMVLDLSRDCDGKNAKQLLANLVTAVETETLMTFRYESTTAYYVEIVGVNGDRTTGTELAQGEYQVTVREVV